MRARYTWHLRPPFNDEFDHSQWWKGQSEIEPAAALYELARRHPRVGKLRLKFRGASWYGKELRAPLTGAAKRRMASKIVDDLGQEPKPIQCLCLIGLKSWPKLDWRDQDFWICSAGNMKGLDSRHEIERCDSITLSALGEVFKKHAFAHTSKAKAMGMAREEFYRFVATDCFINNPRMDDEWKAAVAREAVTAHQQGYLLIAIAPDLAVKDAELLLAKTYRRHLQLKPPEQRASRWKKWFPLISEFENEVNNRPRNEKIDPQIFVHYHRALDAINFETADYGCHPTRCRHILQVNAFFVHSCLNAFFGKRKKKLKLPTTQPN